MSATDGCTRSLPAGVCTIETEFGAAETPVLLGEAGDAAVLGTLTLSELGLAFDPVARTLEPGVFPMMRLGREVVA